MTSFSRTISILALLLFTACGGGNSSESPSSVASAPTDPQSSIDAQVNQRFTETAEAQQAPLATLTIEAAMQQAIQATADYQATVDTAFVEAVRATAAVQATIDTTFNLAVTATAEASRQDWDIVSVTDIGAILDDSSNSIGSFSGMFSNSGQKYAWLGRHNEICFHGFDTGGATCTATQTGSIHIFSLQWSWQDEYIVYTENITLYDESDIWILEPSTGQLQNLTDDGVEGDWLRAENRNFDIDFWPVWHPSRNELIFFRQNATSGDVSLVRMGLDDEVPETIIDLSEAFGDQYSYISWLRSDQAVTQLAISPDGTSLAFATYTSMTDSRNGLWVVNVDTGDLRQIATIDELCRGSTSQCSSPLYTPQDIFWATNGAGIIVNQVEPQSSLLDARLFTYVDVQTGQVTPFFDYSQFDSSFELYDAMQDGQAPVFEGLVLSPDGYTALLMHIQPDHSMSRLSLPPDGSLPTEVLRFEEDDNATYFPWSGRMQALRQNGRGTILGNFIEVEAR